MDIQAFKKEFDVHYEREIDTLVQKASQLSTSAVVRDSLAHIGRIAKGGKRVRPYLLWGIAQSSRDISVSEHIDVLISLELLHLFCLIHDDVMDKAHVRHGVSTIQTFLKEQYPDVEADKREAVAILCGDLVFNASAAAMHRYTVTNSQEHVAEVYHTLVREVCVGQMLDISLVGHNVNEALLYEKNKLKTAYYSFVRPIHMGLLIGGRKEVFALVEDIALHIGILFQLQDDLLDISYTQDTAKDYFRDISTAQPTHISLFMQDHANTHDRDLFASYVGTDIQPAQYPALYELMQSSGAVSFLQDEIQKEIDIIEKALADTRLDKPYVDFIRGIMSYLSHRSS